jgi:hypothetical protein
VTEFIILLITFVALAALYEGMRRASRASARREKEEFSRLLTADEELPTETGRYRVQEMLKRTAPRDPAVASESQHPEQNIQAESTEEQGLPDPFSASKD